MAVNSLNSIDFVYWPYLLLGLIIIPVIWLFSYRSLAGLGRVRRFLALTIRTLIVLLFLFALAEIRWKESSDRVTVIYVLDQSESIPQPKRQLMMTYVREEVKAHRQATREDGAGAVVFGRNAVVESPVFDDDIVLNANPESYIGQRDATNLEDALKLAQSLFTEDTAGRIVIVTDGNENLGDARQTAQVLARNGIGIDVVPIRLTTRPEVAVEKITLPQNVRRGQPVEARVVLNNFNEDGAESRNVKGELRILRMVGNEEQPVGDPKTVDLPPGKTVIRFQHEIESPAMYTYKAIFRPFDSEDDLMSENNVASTFTHVRGKGRIMLIENAHKQGQFEFLIDRLRANNLEIDVRDTTTLFGSLAELQGYDAVILADVPRSSGEDATEVTSFSDEQIAMLVRNTEQMGSGLIMIGGESSFGVGGWANTELEKAMPVDFQIKNKKIQAVGALVMVMHACEMSQGNFWQKVVARESIKTLGPMDYCGLLHWDNFGRDSWLWRPGLARVQDQKQMMMRLLGRMTPGDMPDFEPSLKMALAEFAKNKASVKHMIIISDGDPTPPSRATISQFKQLGVKVSTVAVGAHGRVGHQTLQNIANATEGNYYVVTNPKALPRIYQREARRVAKPLIKDLNNVRPNIEARHPILEGIDGPLPPLKGMVLTTKKDNVLAEVFIRSPDPPDEANATIAAAWTYKNGRTVVFTTDAGHRWASDWTEWENYDKLFSQMVRWAMRPPDDDENFSIATDVRDGKVRVVVTALDENDQFSNFLKLTGSAVGPDLKPFEFKLEQESAGRYFAQFDASKSGSYHVTVGGRGPGKPPIMAGVNVPYSAEYRDRKTNVALLRELARMKPDGGEAGQVVGDDLSESGLGKTLLHDTFRNTLRKSLNIQNMWPLVLLTAGVLFFADVFVRRVAIGYDTFEPYINRVKGWFSKGEEEPQEEHLERLRSRKQAVSTEMDQRMASTRFEPSAEDLETVDTSTLDSAQSGSTQTASRSKSSAPSLGESTDESTYTSRLLDAKKRAWKENEK